MSYIELEEFPDKLKITLTAEGRDELECWLTDPDDKREMSESEMLCQLFEHHTCNGWSWVEPEDIGALTSGPIISPDVGPYDDTGKLEYVGFVYHDDQYQVHSTVDDLLEFGVVEWRRYE